MEDRLRSCKTMSGVDHRASVATALNLLVERTSQVHHYARFSRNFVSPHSRRHIFQAYFISQCAPSTGKYQYIDSP